MLSIAETPRGRFAVLPLDGPNSLRGFPAAQTSFPFVANGHRLRPPITELMFLAQILCCLRVPLLFHIELIQYAKPFAPDFISLGPDRVVADSLKDGFLCWHGSSLH